MNLDGSEATPGFPGFYVFKSILVCVCVHSQNESVPYLFWFFQVHHMQG